MAALGLFTVAIALDRSGTTAGSDVVGTHAYFIAACAMVVPLTSRSMRHAAPWTPVVMASTTLLAYSVVFGTGFFGPGSIHLAAVELAFVGLASALGHALGIAIEQSDDLLSLTTLGESPAIDLEGPLAANEIHTEVARSRRHDRPMSVTVLSPTERGLERALAQAGIELDRSIRTRFMFGSMARAVAGVLRRSDLLFEHRPTGRLIVLSPETDSAGTALLVERIMGAIEGTGIEAAAGTASFPQDGIGFEGLVELAERDLESKTHRAVLRAVENRGGS
jgi:hypothetical protein